MSKVTQTASDGKDGNASILPSKMCLAIHNRTLKNYFPLYLEPSRHIIENVNWYISDSEGTNIGSVLIQVQHPVARMLLIMKISCWLDSNEIREGPMRINKKV